MSETAEQTFLPTKPKPASRSTAPAIWLIVVLVAALAFAATVAYSGGINGALSLVGLSSLVEGASQTPPPAPRKSRSGAAAGSAATTGSVTATASTTATGNATGTKTPAGSSTPASAAGAASAAGKGRLPAAARAAMYREQLQSQGSIGKLVSNQVASLQLGKPAISTNSATVPVIANYRNGSSVSGTMTLRKYNGLWYFYSLTASGGGYTPTPGAIDPSVVAVITREQATPANQDMIKNGILAGGFKTATVTSVSGGSGTAAVNVNLSGGSAAPKKGQFVCISKRDGATTYWFLAKFASK